MFLITFVFTILFYFYVIITSYSLFREQYVPDFPYFPDVCIFSKKYFILYFVLKYSQTLNINKSAFKHP